MSYRGIALIAMMTFTACAGGDEDTESAPAVEATATPVTAAASVDTSGSALWEHLQQANYRSWPKWPGKGELYQGTEPHGMLLTTYVNELALDALTNGAATMPAGAIIVKENYMPDSTFAAATVMHKVSGYNAEGGDWFWAKYDPKGVPEDAGRVAMCQQCHSANKQRDYLMTPIARN